MPGDRGAQGNEVASLSFLSTQGKSPLIITLHDFSANNSDEAFIARIKPLKQVELKENDFPLQTS